MNTTESVFARLDVGVCWEWMGAKTKGYGVVRFDGRNHLVHRWVWGQLVGPIPGGLELDHLCRNRRCANPDHLDPVTHAENMRRSPVGLLTGGRSLAKAQCPAGHAYNEENTYITPAGGRACRACRRLQHRAYLARLNEVEEEDREPKD